MVKVANVNMPEWLASLFVCVGFIIVGVIVIAVLVLALDATSKWYEHRKYIYKQKHRFDKPPLAKCYCKDCEYYAGKDEPDRCYAQKGIYIAENCFCWRATPRIEDPDAEVNE